MEMVIRDLEEPGADFIYFISKLRWLKQSIYGTSSRVFTPGSNSKHVTENTVFSLYILKK